MSSWEIRSKLVRVTADVGCRMERQDGCSPWSYFDMVAEAAYPVNKKYREKFLAEVERRYEYLGERK